MTPGEWGGCPPGEGECLAMCFFSFRLQAQVSTTSFC